MWSDMLRKRMARIFTGEKKLILRNCVPSRYELGNKINDLEEVGIYLHIPFCEQLCPYCPYHKEIYSHDKAERYTRAVLREIEYYTRILGNLPVTSFYIGGGTPTTMLNNGIGKIIDTIYRNFNMKCLIHMESHPNHLSADNLDLIRSMGVRYLSIGVESLQDRHLKTLKRPYSAREVYRNVRRVTERGFDCVNADLIFDLPDQTVGEIEEAGRKLIEMGINQAATYPLFRFPYTKFGSESRYRKGSPASLIRRRRMLHILEDVFYASGFERTSVWAFTEKGVEKYCSVTVPQYIGLGASGSTYLKDLFYLNTFNVSCYLEAMQKRENAIALSMPLSEKMQMAGWLYWRIYETRFSKTLFKERFNRNFDHIYGKLIGTLSFLGFLEQYHEEVVLSDKGSYWLHAFEDLFSIDYISKLWGRSQLEGWPEVVVL